MAEWTLEQQQAMALAAARARAAEAEAQQPQEAPANKGWGASILDGVKSFGQGAVDSATNMLEPIQNISSVSGRLGIGAAEKVRDFIGLPFSDEQKAEHQKVLQQVDAMPRPATAIKNAMGLNHKPETTTGELGYRAGTMVPAAIGGPGSAVSKGILGVALPAAAGQATKEALKGTTLEKYSPYIEMGAESLAPLAAIPAVRAITPNPIDKTRQNMVDILSREGVDLTAGQKTGNEARRRFEAQTMGMEKNIPQQEAFSAAVMRRAGIEGENRATQPVLNQAFETVGKKFDDLAKTTTVPLDQKLQTDLLDHVVRYQNLSGTPAKGPEQIMNRISEIAKNNNGVIPGEAYQGLRSSLGADIRTASGDTKQVLRDLQSSLDDAVERHMPQGQLQAWREARNEYRNLLVVEKATTAGGENAALGLLSPAQVRTANKSVMGTRAQATGKGDLSELAEAGTAVMKPLSDSGTAKNASAMLGGALNPATIATGAGLASAAAGQDIKTALTAALLAGGASLAPAAVNSLRGSGLGRAYHANQLLAGASREIPTNASKQAFVNALMQQSELADRIRGR